ncbi:uncharacterized protein EDB93DRAFT_641209 [Suillus bovinus]|uniref:uncharacterized protein n=1 Tax=Suillus bovinus TaxID=48563 RepID=UPI001B86C300|nr:uncharacterized protein EDB93DRAFT_641209 [Suillus bovinus]KAG2141175.1 hypothetical protein EDB93DRAFT_641209 [Suillus bovinus]
MIIISNHPSWWPSVESYRISSYIIVASSVRVIYDWALTFGREIELVWRQCCSLMTILYLSVRYAGISYAVIQILANVPTTFGTGEVSRIMSILTIWINLIVHAKLSVIMMARLYAMYQGSRKVLIILITILLAVYITGGLVTAMSESNSSWEELTLFGTFVALCFALCVTVKHFRELRRYSAGGMGLFCCVNENSHCLLCVLCR